MSPSPSPSMSATCIWAPPEPKSKECFDHGPRPGLAGCSHQPFAIRKSARPSPLTSPTPRPWVYRCQSSFSEQAVNGQRSVPLGSLGPAKPSIPLVWKQSSSRSSPLISAKVGDSLSTVGKASCRCQPAACRTLSPGFLNQATSLPGQTLTNTSRWPSASTSATKVAKLLEYL